MAIVEDDYSGNQLSSEKWSCWKKKEVALSRQCLVHFCVVHRDKWREHLAGI
jgi:hypothetical protein